MNALRALRRAVRHTMPATMLALAACSGSGPPPAMPPPEVDVARVLTREIDAWNEHAGRIEAVQRVEIRPRVTGYLAQQHYTEGAVVERGALLFSIDDREYRAAVDAAEANLARARARAEFARTELARTEKLASAGAASVEETERGRAALRQAQAEVEAAAAELQRARLNLEFTRILAPIEGRASAAAVKPGNLVAAGSTLLTTLVSIDPVYVSFDGDEQSYLRYRDLVGRADVQQSTAAVAVGLTDEAGWPHAGRLVFVDNAIDPATGTFRARAEVANPDGRLTPGSYARVRVRIGMPEPALLIDERAILTDQDRKFVYVLGPNDTALRREIVPGTQLDGLRVIRSGLAADDRVVVNGSRKIFYSGMPVKPREVPMDRSELAAAAASEPAGR